MKAYLRSLGRLRFIVQMLFVCFVAAVGWATRASNCALVLLSIKMNFFNSSIEPAKSVVTSCCLLPYYVSRSCPKVAVVTANVALTALARVPLPGFSGILNDVGTGLAEELQS